MILLNLKRIQYLFPKIIPVIVVYYEILNFLLIGLLMMEIMSQTPLAQNPHHKRLFFIRIEYRILIEKHAIKKATFYLVCQNLNFRFSK